MAKVLRFSGDVFEEDAPSEVLVEMKKPVFGGLHEMEITNPCCLKISRWNRISRMVNHLAIGAQSLPKSVLFMKLKWLTVLMERYVSGARRDWSGTISLGRRSLSHG